jgi:peptidoglycan/xylan/chitin deacetylase (PgdA/CDA1 family)
VTTFIPVLLYHSVSDRARGPGRRWTVSTSEFAAQVSAVSASGRTPLTVSEIADGLRGERALPARPVGITFDDGFSDTYVAVGELLSRGLRSTVYVTTGEMATRNRLSRLQLAALAEMPSVELGAHSVHHRRLDQLGDRELAAEVCDSKAQLEDAVGASIHTFAYPHGAYDRAAREAVITAGFRSAAAVKNALSHDSDDPFAIARWTVTAATSAARLTEVLEGKGVIPAWANERLRTRAYRAARRSWRALIPAGARR